MAIIFDECDQIVTEFLTFGKCGECGIVFREDESEWASLCQECGWDEDDTDDE